MASSLESFTSEYDQNAILAELDRVLRSTNLAERCEGIVKLPQYFDKYPFPVFITAAFLRLVEAFRNGTNLTRKWILHVAERSARHLDKIISRDELMKRILTVSHSNDPNARALTMKLFAYFARILADRKQMHHLICTSLDSNDIGELHAAIFAAQRFAKQSPEFGRSVFDKVMEMVMSIDVPPETKLLLVPIFEHFYSDAGTSQKTIIFCRDQFLPHCHSSAIIGSVLTSLTKLAVNAIIIAPIQLSLLLSHLTSKRVSKRVVLMTLDCLHYVARETPHLWTPEALKALCHVCDDSDETGSTAETVTLRALCVLATLTKSPITRLWSVDEGRRLAELCSTHCFAGSHLTMSAACLIAANMVQNLDEGSLRDQLINTLILALTVAIPISPWRDDRPVTVKAGMNILRCVLRLVAFDPVTAQSLAQCLLSVIGSCSDENLSAITECILALCDADLVVAEQLQTRQMQAPVNNDLLGSSLLLVPKSSVSLINGLSIPIDQITSRCASPWQRFLIGRRALRYGYAEVAKSVFRGLQEIVSSEQYLQWIKSLSTVALAEECLWSETEAAPIDRLALAIYNHQLALIHMKAAASSNYQLSFPIAFVGLRQQFLSAVKELHTVWGVAVLVPPSTSVASDASISENKLSRLVTQFSNCEKRFSEISSSYDALNRRCFDADDGTIELLKLLRLQCFLVQEAIGLFIGKQNRKPLTVSESNYNAQTQIVSKHLGWMAKEVGYMLAKFDSITKEGVEYLLAVVDHVCFEIPFFIPRFFFQSLQSSTVKLVLTPKPTDRDNVFRLPSDQRLLLNVEGVVTITSSAARVFRKIERVIVRVSSEFPAGAQPVSDVKPRSKLPVTGIKLEKVVPMRNDYFSADFVMDFHASGVINVHIDLIDDRTGIIWDGNVDEQLRIKVLPVAGSSDVVIPFPPRAPVPGNSSVQRLI